MPVRLGVPQHVSGLGRCGEQSDPRHRGGSCCLYAKSNFDCVRARGDKRFCWRAAWDYWTFESDEELGFREIFKDDLLLSPNPQLKEIRIMFELMDAVQPKRHVIKVLGVGGGGGNAVSHMVQAGLEGVDFICINTDAQALKHSKVRTALQIGCNITKGLGAGADPGSRPASRDGGSRSHYRADRAAATCCSSPPAWAAAPAPAPRPWSRRWPRNSASSRSRWSRSPFEMEGNKRSRVADHGMVELAKYVDSLITIPNQKLLTVLGQRTPRCSMPSSRPTPCCRARCRASRN